MTNETTQPIHDGAAIRTAVIGCGAMGGGMALRLLSQGVPVFGFDAEPDRRRALAADGVEMAPSAGDAVVGAHLAILSLPTADVVERVMLGDGGVGDRLAPGAIVVDASTSDPIVTQRLAAEGVVRGWRFLDAPVSGGPAGARGGTMTMLVGGDAAALAAARPVLDALATTIVHVGPSGAGHAAKIANNMLCAANLVLVAEAVRLGKAAGIAPEALLEGVNAGSGRSGVSEVNFPRWIVTEGFDSGFTMGLMRKDVRLATALAARMDVATPAFERIADLWAESAERLPDVADFNAIATLEEDR